ncbi:hypothetical protein IKE83_02755 [Candidatus Saccharibacteria bacterium]|nr:hypothetical protein [Candidatus Saccharibacteria bacterium]
MASKTSRKKNVSVGKRKLKAEVAAAGKKNAKTEKALLKKTRTGGQDRTDGVVKSKKTVKTKVTLKTRMAGALKKFTGVRKAEKAKRVRLHKSFKRSYREEYARELNVPGVMHHIFATFGMIFKNWRVFLLLFVLTVVVAAVLVGLMSESTYKQFQEILDQTSEQMGVEDLGPVAKAGLLLISTVTTGGLSGSAGEAAGVFAVLIFLVVWLVTIFLVRHILAGNKVKLRDALYNAMTPFISTIVVFLIALVQAIPIFILIIVYSAAVQTEFLATPFYALVFFIFAAAMILLSGYLLSSTLMALVAVSAPGMYPMRAMHAASDLMAGRRIRFLLRIVALILALVILWVLVMVPLLLFDLFMKQFEWTAGVPFVPICLVMMTSFTAIYVSVYLYLYYRWMLGN